MKVKPYNRTVKHYEKAHNMQLTWRYHCENLLEISFHDLNALKHVPGLGFGATTAGSCVNVPSSSPGIMNGSLLDAPRPLIALVFNVLNMSLVLMYRGELTFFLRFFFTCRDFALGLAFSANLKVVEG